MNPHDLAVVRQREDDAEAMVLTAMCCSIALASVAAMVLYAMR